MEKIGPRVKFQNKILVLGCGGVAQCVIPLLLRHLELVPGQITVLEKRDNRNLIADAIAAGVHYVQERLTHESYREQLQRHVGPGDILLDLAWNLETTALLDWCRQHGVRFLNTSVELWDPYSGHECRPITELTLYQRQMEIDDLIAKWGDNSGPTAVLDHGANPGLVSHFTKQALTEIAQRILKEKPLDPRFGALRHALEHRHFNELAHLTGVKVIHVSERDTQTSSRQRKEDEFVNTWSVEGFYEEGIAPAELGWGTHERQLPFDAQTHSRGPRNQICLQRKGMNTWVRSWCPSGEIRGMVIRHGEAFSISERLTTYDADGQVSYRPTVHYAYLPCDDALRSLAWLRQHDYRKPEHERILRDDIVSGYDELGCLLMGHDFQSWWIGSQLDIEASRKLIPGQNATTVQVASSVLGALFWLMENPQQGVKLPDDLPHEFVLNIAMPYLGKFRSYAVDWSPNRSTTSPSTHSATPANLVAQDEPSSRPRQGEEWQFADFLVQESASQ